MNIARVEVSLELAPEHATGDGLPRSSATFSVSAERQQQLMRLPCGGLCQHRRVGRFCLELVRAISQSRALRCQRSL